MNNQNNNNINNNHYTYSQANQLWSLFGHLPRSFVTHPQPTYRNYMTMTNEQRETERLLRETLNTPSTYKYVMDPSSSNLILKIPYTRTTLPINNEEDTSNPNLNLNIKNEYDTICPITLEDFYEGEIVSKLPCNHIFKTDAIENWLSTQKAECPVCRFKMPSIEVRNIDEQNSINELSRSNQTHLTNQNHTNHNNYNINNQTNYFYDEDSDDETEEMFLNNLSNLMNSLSVLNNLTAYNPE